MEKDLSLHPRILKFLQAAFRALDTSKAGRISAVDVKRGLRRFDPEATLARAREAIWEVDLQGTNYCSFEDFERGFRNCVEDRSGFEPRKLFYLALFLMIRSAHDFIIKKAASRGKIVTQAPDVLSPDAAPLLRRSPRSHAMRELNLHLPEFCGAFAAIFGRGSDARLRTLLAEAGAGEKTVITLELFKRAVGHDLLFEADAQVWKTSQRLSPSPSITPRVSRLACPVDASVTSDLKTSPSPVADRNENISPLRVSNSEARGSGIGGRPLRATTEALSRSRRALLHLQAREAAPQGRRPDVPVQRARPQSAGLFRCTYEGAPIMGGVRPSSARPQISRSVSLVDATLKRAAADAALLRRPMSAKGPRPTASGALASSFAVAITAKQRFSAKEERKPWSFLESRPPQSHALGIPLSVASETPPRAELDQLYRNYGFTRNAFSAPKLPAADVEPLGAKRLHITGSAAALPAGGPRPSSARPLSSSARHGPPPANIGRGRRPMTADPRRRAAGRTEQPNARVRKPNASPAGARRRTVGRQHGGTDELMEKIQSLLSAPLPGRLFPMSKESAVPQRGAGMQGRQRVSAGGKAIEQTSPKPKAVVLRAPSRAEQVEAEMQFQDTYGYNAGDTAMRNLMALDTSLDNDIIALNGSPLTGQQRHEPRRDRPKPPPFMMELGDDIPSF